MHIPRGDYVLLTGDAGSGKSVLFQMILGYEEPSRGTVQVFGRNLEHLNLKDKPFLRRRIGWISQEPQFMHSRSVYENLLNVLHASSIFGLEAEQRTVNMLKSVELELDLDMMPAELSKGQSQKLAIARALLLQPAILLADDPFTFLSAEEIHKVAKLFHDYNEQGTTILLTSRLWNPRESGVKRILEISDAVVMEPQNNLPVVSI
jgi:cell division transport system ATP-binding protein